MSSKYKTKVVGFQIKNIIPTSIGRVMICAGPFISGEPVVQTIEI